MRANRPQDAGAPLRRLRKICPRLQPHTLNHNLVRRPRSSLLSRGAHDDLGVFDPIDHPAKDRVLLIKSWLLFQRNEPLAVRAVDILSARRADSAALVGNVAEFSR